MSVFIWKPIHFQKGVGVDFIHSAAPRMVARYLRSTQLQSRFMQLKYKKIIKIKKNPGCLVGKDLENLVSSVPS